MSSMVGKKQMASLGTMEKYIYNDLVMAMSDGSEVHSGDTLTC